MIGLTHDDLLLPLANTEDSTVERKTAADYRDCLKTAVAFSNSLPIGDPGIIFVGVYNDGRIQDNNNLETIQKNVSKQINKIYKPISPQLVVVKKGGKNGQTSECLAVIVRGSRERPHFAGAAYIREGSESLPASEDQFRKLITQRNSKARVILQWQAKDVILEVEHVRTNNVGYASAQFKDGIQQDATVLECNQFYAILRIHATASIAERTVSLSIPSVELGFDPAKGKLILRDKFSL